MTLKEFDKVLQEDKELYKKLKKAKKDFKPEKGKEAEAMSKIVASLGYDIPASEFALEKIGKKEVNEEELKSVAGGSFSCYFKDYVNRPTDYKDTGCIYNFIDTDCGRDDFCNRLNIRYLHVGPNCHYDYIDTDCISHDYCDFLYGDY